MNKADRPLIVATVLVWAIAGALFVWASCRSATRAATAGAAAIVASPGGPVASGLSAMAGDVFGDKIADMLGADKEYTAEEYRKILDDAAKELDRAHKTIAALQAREPIREPYPVDRPFIPWWGWIAIVLLSFHYVLKLFFPRSRTQILHAIRDAFTLKLGSAITRLGAADGVVHTDTAERIAEHAAARRRRRKEVILAKEKETEERQG